MVNKDEYNNSEITFMLCSNLLKFIRSWVPARSTRAW